MCDLEEKEIWDNADEENERIRDFWSDVEFEDWRMGKMELTERK